MTNQTPLSELANSCLKQLWHLKFYSTFAHKDKKLMLINATGKQLVAVHSQDLLARVLFKLVIALSNNYSRVANVLQVNVILCHKLSTGSSSSVLVAWEVYICHSVLSGETTCNA